jgi:hypothetical protein
MSGYTTRSPTPGLSSPDWTGTVHYGPSMVYDSARGKAILFGGFTEGMPHVDLSDTWAYDITLGDR